MEIEQLEVLAFIRQFEPFDKLSEEQLELVASQVSISYYRADCDIFLYGDPISDLYMVRSGSVEIFRRNGELYNRLGEGELFGQMGLLMNKKVRLPARAIEDTLVYLIPDHLFYDLCEQSEQFADFVELEDRRRLRQVVSNQNDGNDLMSSRVNMLLNRPLVTIDVHATIREAAQKMTEAVCSSVLVEHVDGADKIYDYQPQAEHNIVGIVTDSDLRIRVLAKGIDLDSPIGFVMSKELVTIESQQFVFEALMTMLRYNLQHLPVLSKRKPLGIIDMMDIIRYESQSSLFIVSGIFAKNSVDELAILSDDVKDCFVRMVNEDANSRMIGSAMAVIGRSFKQRLLELAEMELGPPPIPYCFLALGSMARDEQLIVTDQDNALVLDNRYDEQVHGEYFAKLAEFVCQGLARCGYSLCKGNIMASNPQWRMSLKNWQQCFSEWIAHPTPRSLLDSNIFFDLDGVWGKTEWADQLRLQIQRQARRSPSFLACMARNALNRTPPLGFFKDFVMEKNGQHNNSINLKRRGSAPLVDLIRVHALSLGITEQNSFDRLNAIDEANILPKGRASDLRDALEFISMVRIRHQASDIELAQEPDNNIEPEALSAFEQRHLKDAFQIVSNAQKYLKFRYQTTKVHS
ncbi:DUF294 nucleotidyltransferase-like domain-containing protein [Celerinatantimonas diazotrophica]|uniref:CBS domain-containing protein n=1 Tax=Celerinatantimonas diazotrophica TaxID=412034 RepID=A0A4R1JLU3_9GAMM|nr:DUF294 nucleotidyltransferase-like domain-containing protein [Celerinatantimonas diazotrophica]TCK52032.1 CBS domain-containing protein [Celerinatantimonas diazotrophica]CAG9296265.1 hypothetical protein CEDIAZO_01413 [Celerinatantimonas diazotrophica]